MRTPDEPVETTRVGPKRELDGEPCTPGGARCFHPTGVCNDPAHC